MKKIKEFWEEFNPKISEKNYTVLGLWWAWVWRLWLLIILAGVAWEIIKSFTGYGVSN
jgi:hypothetical protein